MPRLAEGIFAAHYDSAVKLAAAPGGVSRPDLIKKLGVTRLVAEKIIEKAGLVVGGKEGRTEFFVPPDSNLVGAATSAAPSPAVVVEPVATSSEGLTGIVVTSSPPPVVIPAPVKGKGGRPRKVKVEEPAPVVAAVTTPVPEVVASPVASVAPPAVTSPTVTETATEEDNVGAIDADIIDVRKALADACQKAGKAMFEWATHQALADSLQEKLRVLIGKRLSM